MGKKYFDTKDNTLESSILGVWENAVSETVDRAKANLDARTKEYKVHQEKLASSRLRRENNKKITKEEVELDESQIDEEIAELNALIEELEEGILGNIAKAAGKTVAKGAKAVGKKVAGKVKKKAGGSMVGKAFGKAKAGVKKAKKIGGKIKKAAKTGKAYGDEYNPMLEKLEIIESKLNNYCELLEAEFVDLDEGTKEEYQKFFNAAMKKFKIDSPADLKSDEEKKKFFDYVDKNYKGEKDENFESRLKETIGIKESFEIGTNEYRDHTLEVTPGETNPEWVAARDFKVASMKEALAKVWGLDEKKDEYDEEDEELKPVKGSKTMTGGKVAKVDTKPKIVG